MSLEEIHMEKYPFTKSYYSLQQAACANSLCIFWKTQLQRVDTLYPNLFSRTELGTYTLSSFFFFSILLHMISVPVLMSKEKQMTAPRYQKNKAANKFKSELHLLLGIVTSYRTSRAGRPFHSMRKQGH
jgi:hypothetical protein